jgi:hypothetical protein
LPTKDKFPMAGFVLEIDAAADGDDGVPARLQEPYGDDASAVAETQEISSADLFADSRRPLGHQRSGLLENGAGLGKPNTTLCRLPTMLSQS